MTERWLALTILVAAIAPAHARAASCTVEGTVQINPLDTYYCDQSWQSTSECSGWLEKDLDSTTRPMKYLALRLTNTTGTTTYGYAFTDATGFFSYTIVQSGWSTCSGHSVDAEINFARIHEDDLGLEDVGDLPRGRFLIVDPADDTLQAYVPNTFDNQALSGGSVATTNIGTMTFGRTLTANNAYIANVYYIMNSAVTEIVTWTTNLDTRFSSIYGGCSGDDHVLCVRYDFNDSSWEPSCGGSGCADGDDWRLELNETLFNDGALVRHEVGHLVYFALHGLNQGAVGGGVSCTSSMLDNVDGRGPISCEWGVFAMAEGLPSFWGIRSVMEHNTNGNVWWCPRSDDTDLDNQDSCSQQAEATHDSDRVEDLPWEPTSDNLGWRGIGDNYVTSRCHCSRLSTSSQGCTICVDGDNNGLCPDDPADYNACPDTSRDTACGDPSGSGGDTICDDYKDMGFRNTNQVARFFWDILDGNNEGSDDSDFNASTLADVFEDMKCLTGSSDYGGDEDGCNEPHRFSGGTCNPPNQASGSVWGIHTTTRDSYNIYDLAWAIPDTPTDQSGERSLNCVEDATD